MAYTNWPNDPPALVIPSAKVRLFAGKRRPTAPNTIGNVVAPTPIPINTALAMKKPKLLSVNAAQNIPAINTTAPPSKIFAVP